MTRWRTSRRGVLKTAAGTAAASALFTAAPYVRSARTQTTLSLGLWDHWVPGANAECERLCREWGAANNVEVSVDFITSAGERDVVTAAAEARARRGHDILAMRTFVPAQYVDQLESLDDVVAEITSQHGDFTAEGEYLNRHDGVWRAIPAPTGSHTYPIEARLDLILEHAGVDLREVFPAGPRTAEQQAYIDEWWTRETFLDLVRTMHEAGYPFGDAISPASDSQDWLGPLFASFGAHLVDADGNLTVDTDEVRTAIEYVAQLVPYMPDDIYAWDDAANNRWLISGRGSMIHNPPSAWAVAVRDAPEIGEQVWHIDIPRGPAGRFRGSLPWNWGVWEFGENKQAAKDLLVWLSDKEQVSHLLRASRGYDMPLLPSYWDHPVWEEEGPPEGTIYNYPIRGDEEVFLAGMPAPARVGANIYLQGIIPAMVAEHTQAGLSIDDAIHWAEDELAGLMR